MARAVGVVLAVGEFVDQGPFEGALGVLGLGAGRLQLLEGLVNAVKVGVGRQQGDRCLGTDAIDSRNVVAGVAGEGLEIDDLFWGHTQLGDHPVAAHLGRAAVFGVGAAAHVKHGDVALVVDQLK